MLFFMVRKRRVRERRVRWPRSSFSRQNHSRGLDTQWGDRVVGGG